MPRSIERLITGIETKLEEYADRYENDPDHIPDEEAKIISRLVELRTKLKANNDSKTVNAADLASYLMKEKV